MQSDTEEKRRRIVRYGYAALFALLFGVLAAAMVTGASLPFDLFVRASVHGLASNGVTAMARLFSWIGSSPVWVSAAAVIATILSLASQRRGALALAAAMSGAAVLENGLKLAFHRTRPETFFGTEPGSYSFPSGHALFAICFYGALAFIVSRWAYSSPIRAAVWAAAALLVLCIGFSRIYLGVHYPSDVAAGYLVGSAWLAFLWATGLFAATAPRD